MKSNIFITGFSGTGKSSVGREVADRLGWRFLDTDDLIAASAGKPIQRIFDVDGEAVFRRLERECLASAARGERQVISTGGGIAEDGSNRKVMEGNGVVVCLEARPETIHERLETERRGGGEPVVRLMLAGSDPLATIRSLKDRKSVV